MSRLKGQYCFTSHCPLLLIILLSSKVIAYNFDTKNAIVFSEPSSPLFRRNTYFGFSVALYTSGNDSTLLVGAPRGNSSSTFGSIREPGIVYNCPFNNQKCREWYVDKLLNGAVPRYPFIDQIKDNAWIGAVIAVENKTQPNVVVCGPRWKNNISIRNRPNWYMNGICYTIQTNDISDFDYKNAQNRLVLPLQYSQQIATLDKDVSIYNFGMGGLGLSMFMRPDKDQYLLAIGAPGIFNWRGSSMLVTKTYSGTDNTIIPFSAAEKSLHSCDYFGYSITSGCYFKQGEYWYASGAPRGANLYGNVFIYSYPRQTNRAMIGKKIEEGQQHGEYFGASLASCDINDDGKDELFVGAPLWSKVEDEGRVYIFSARYNEIFERQILEGEYIRGRFGHSIMCLGDIDFDGYKDVAIGAPYEENVGAVYIYNGNRNGLIKKYSQRILGSQFSSNVRGFGISISEPKDANFDKHADIAIGAYLSEQAVFLRSRAVIMAMINLKYTEKKKLLMNSTLFNIDTCIYYDGAYVPESLDFIMTLKIDQLHGRAVYTGNSSGDNTYKLREAAQRAKHTCTQHTIYLRPNIQNLIDPIEITVLLDLENDTVQDEKSKSNMTCVGCPVINKALSKTEDRIRLPFAVDCGEDNVCVSDLYLRLSTDLTPENRYIIGSASTIKLIIDIFNRDEPAYQSKVHLHIPEVLSLASVPPECMESDVNGTFEVVCDVGNPLRKNNTFLLELDTSEVRFGIESTELWANVTTQSEESNPTDNIYNMTIHFDIDIDIAIAGKTLGDLYSYLDEEKEDILEEIRYQHVYEVQKFGASPIEEATLLIKVPTAWKQGNTGIEINSVNQTTGRMDGRRFLCSYTKNLGLTLPVTSVDTGDMNSIEVELTVPVANLILNTHEKFTIEETSQISVPPENRTLYLNCSNPDIECGAIECKLGPFKSDQSVAKLLITMDLRLSNFEASILKGKDIIYLVTEGYVNITEPSDVVQKVGHKPDNALVATTFLGIPAAQQVASWIIALSVLLGILLLILLILGLVKVGFFNRKKKKELEALKAEENQSHGVVLETTSSQEELDHD